MDHAAGVPDHHKPLSVALGAPHPHLERPALGRPFWFGTFEPPGDLRFFEKALEEVLEVAARAGECPGRDAGSNVRPAVTEIEVTAVAGAVVVHILGDKDVQVLFVGPLHTAVVLPPGDGVLVRLHAAAREATHTVGRNHKGASKRRVSPSLVASIPVTSPAGERRRSVALMPERNSAPA